MKIRHKLNKMSIEDDFISKKFLPVYCSNYIKVSIFNIYICSNCCNYDKSYNSLTLHTIIILPVYTSDNNWSKHS